MQHHLCSFSHQAKAKGRWCEKWAQTSQPNPNPSPTSNTPKKKTNAQVGSLNPVAARAMLFLRLPSFFVFLLSSSSSSSSFFLLLLRLLLLLPSSYSFFFFENSTRTFLGVSDGVVKEVGDATSVEGGRAANNAVNLISSIEHSRGYRGNHT